MTWFAFVGLLLATIIVVGAASVAAYDRLVAWFERLKGPDGAADLAAGSRNHRRRNEAPPMRPGVSVTRGDVPVATTRDTFAYGYGHAWTGVTSPATLVTARQRTKPALGPKAFGSKALLSQGSGSKPGQGRAADLDGLAHVKVIRRSGA